MLSPPAKAHSRKTRKELIADLERIERFLGEPRKIPATRVHSQSPRGGGFDGGANHHAQQYVGLAVADTGTGVPSEVQERVFEPFFTTKGMAEHSGLGSSMVHGFVNQLGGFVELATEVGKGATVSLYLPRMQE